METTPFHASLQNFLQFLNNIGKDITLVAHNGFTFDARLLIRDIRSYNMGGVYISRLRIYRYSSCPEGEIAFPNCG